MSSGHQRIKWRRNIAENFNWLSRVHERYRQTDRRQTDGLTTTYSEHEHEFTFAKNKRNFSTIASRVKQKSLPLSHTRRARKKSPPTVRYFGGHDHQTAAVVTTARSPLLPSQQLRRCQRWNGHDTTGIDHRSVPPAHSRSTPFPEPRNAFDMHEVRRPTHRQHHAFTIGCPHDLHTSFT